MRNQWAALVFVLSLASGTAGSSTFPGPHWRDAGNRAGIDPLLLYAVALAESARQRRLNMISPWPLAIRHGLTSYYPSKRAEAETLLERLLADNAPHELDIGLMQINLRWHGHRVGDPADLLDANINLALGADILADALRSAPEDLTLGIGRYHSWEDKRARWYGERVLSIYNKLKIAKEARP